MIVLNAISFCTFLLCVGTLYGAYKVADTPASFWKKDDRPAIVLVAIVGLHGLIRTFI